jgi:hypothetical protein
MRRYLAMGLALGLAACQSVRSEVTTFHTLPEQSVKTFWVMPAAGPPLENASYAGLIAGNLEEHGWTQAKDSPEVTVQFSYGIDNGQTRVGSMPIIGQTGGGTTFSSGVVTGSGGFANVFRNIVHAGDLRRRWRSPLLCHGIYSFFVRHDVGYEVRSLCF